MRACPLFHYCDMNGDGTVDDDEMVMCAAYAVDYLCGMDQEPWEFA